MGLESVSDEVFGFHCQQSAEKMIKALLADLGVAFNKTHNIEALMRALSDNGMPVPESFESLGAFTPFGALYRYEDVETGLGMDRRQARAALREFRVWVEARIFAKSC